MFFAVLKTFETIYLQPMKNKALLIAVFVVFNIVCKAQDSISFKMHFLPLHKYEQTVTQQLKSITTFFASDSV
ncbi:MAG TPA: hypothetical protein VHB70_16660, partial [Parafilimonas sp.]|nr:hypothetical protein [Parafilimonas sp.]